MNLYLDDNIADHHLVALLRKGGHGVVTPEEVGLTGESDPNHMVHALRQQLLLLTRNYKDFEVLHEVIVAAGGKHLEKSGIALANQVWVLNQWR